MKENMLTIVPARGGSKRIPNKNVRMFLGKEILSYPIVAALGSKFFNQVIVSTDSEEIQLIASSYGAEIPFLRSAKNSDDFATTFDVIKEVLIQLDTKYKYVCCIYPTSVFVTSEMLDKAITMLESDPKATSIVSVLEYSHPIQRSLKMNGSYLSSNFPEFYNSRSQDLEKNYHDAGQFYIFKPSDVLKEERLITNDCIPFIINPNHAQDIDTFEDWALAELKYKFIVGDV